MTPAWLDRLTRWCLHPIGRRIYNRQTTRWPLPVTRGETLLVTLFLAFLGLPGLALGGRARLVSQ